MLLKHDRYYVNLAFEIAKGSKCRRATYGSLIVAADGKRIVATGYNGKPAGCVNDNVCYREGLAPNSGVKANCCLHSEVNALMFSDPLARQGGTMYVSGRPCRDCALVIMQSGIARLVYYDGASPQGHLGDSDDEFWKQYSPRGVADRVPYTHLEWETLYGD